VGAAQRLHGAQHGASKVEYFNLVFDLPSIARLRKNRTFAHFVTTDGVSLHAHFFQHAAAVRPDAQAVVGHASPDMPRTLNGQARARRQRTQGVESGGLFARIPRLVRQAQQVEVQWAGDDDVASSNSSSSLLSNSALSCVIKFIIVTAVMNLMTQLKAEFDSSDDDEFDDTTSSSPAH
jgi:hypothetical protein